MQNSKLGWKKIRTTVLLEHPRLTVLEDDVELPNGHQTKYIYFDGSQDAVTVIATRGDELLIQKEYSYPPNEMLYQFPGGGMEGNETPEAGALRELKEESGYTGTPHYLGFYYFNNRRSSSKMHVVHITNPKECKKEGGDIEEHIVSEWVSRTNLNNMISAGKVANFAILAALPLLDAKVEV